MKKICLFNYPPQDNFHGYQLETFDPLSYFDKSSHWSISDFISWGHVGYSHRRAITAGAAGVDRLYRERNPNYMRMVGDFIDRFRDFDVIVMSSYNFIHPEILDRELKNPIKILGFIDDPLSTYQRGIPYLWAFDGAFFISPSYIDNLTFPDAVKRWSNKPIRWWPLVPYPYDKPKKDDEDFFRNRDIDLVYVGNPSASKVDRLIKIKSHFGKKVKIHGRWPLKGYFGIIRGVLGKPIYPHYVSSLSSNERTELYWNTKIGFNMHVSDYPYETGNMRMYEVPAHGMLMVSDKGGGNCHEKIFEADKEAVFYNDIDEAISQIEYFLNHEDERIEIAKAGYKRYLRDYEWEINMKKFLDWTMSLKNKNYNYGENK